jgi:hypothetical protein
MIVLNYSLFCDKSLFILWYLRVDESLVQSDFLEISRSRSLLSLFDEFVNYIKLPLFHSIPILSWSPLSDLYTRASLLFCRYLLYQ